jgi:hypothetical protein
MRKLQLTRSTDNDRTNSYYKSSHYVSDATVPKKIKIIFGGIKIKLYLWVSKTKIGDRLLNE